MTVNDDTISERTEMLFARLSACAQELNLASDALTKSVNRIDVSLKRLNLGITAWLDVDRWEGGDKHGHEFWCDQIGYAKVNGKWGISLRRVEGSHRSPEDEEIESWPFSDAPRSLRLAAIDKIPDLLEKLAQQSASSARTINSKLALVGTVAESLESATEKSDTKKPPIAHEQVRMNRRPLSEAG